MRSTRVTSFPIKSFVQRWNRLHWDKDGPSKRRWGRFPEMLP